MPFSYYKCHGTFHVTRILQNASILSRLPGCKLCLEFQLVKNCQVIFLVASTGKQPEGTSI